MVHLPCIEGVARIIEGTPGDAPIEQPCDERRVGGNMNREAA
jgi:hypothetical protein